jgi:hypothetical protein
MSAKYPDHGPGRWPAGSPELGERLRERGWVTWLKAAPSSVFPNDPDYHQHEFGSSRSPLSHRHVRGTEPHDHEPA